MAQCDPWDYTPRELVLRADQLHDFQPSPEQLQAMLDRLPKALTPEQRRAVWERNDATRQRERGQGR
jgi:hypothetical protein